MNNVELIKKENFFYKMGVMCGALLYSTYKFDDFEKMMESAKGIKDRYGRDMLGCQFVIQTFRDGSYDFEKSCFSQIVVPVNDINLRFDRIMNEIMEDSNE